MLDDVELCRIMLDYVGLCWITRGTPPEANIRLRLANIKLRLINIRLRLTNIRPILN